MIQDHLVEFKWNHMIQSGDDIFHNIHKFKVDEVILYNLLRLDQSIGNKIVPWWITSAEYLLNVELHEIWGVFELSFIKVVVHEVNYHVAICVIHVVVDDELGSNQFYAVVTI